MLVELLCLLVFTLRLVHYARVIPQDKFWKDPKNICIIAIVSVGRAYLHCYMTSVLLVSLDFLPYLEAVNKLTLQRQRGWCEGPWWLGAESKAPPLLCQPPYVSVTTDGFCLF